MRNDGCSGCGGCAGLLAVCYVLWGILSLLSGYWGWATNISITPYPNLNGVLVSGGMVVAFHVALGLLYLLFLLPGAIIVRIRKPTGLLEIETKENASTGSLWQRLLA